MFKVEGEIFTCAVTLPPLRLSSSPRSSFHSSSWSTAPCTSSTGCGGRRWGSGPSCGGLCVWWCPWWWCSLSASSPAPLPERCSWACACRWSRAPRTSWSRSTTAWWSCPTWTACSTRWSTASATPASRTPTFQPSAPALFARGCSTLTLAWEPPTPPPSPRQPHPEHEMFHSQ